MFPLKLENFIIAPSEPANHPSSKIIEISDVRCPRKPATTTRKAGCSKTNMASSKRERALAEKTLICLLQACEGHKAIVELRNESFAEGTISQVDGYMNVNMKDVEFNKQSSKTLHLEELFIQAKQIRFVHIPDEINMREAIEGQLKTLKNSRVPMTRKFQKRKK